MSIDSFVKRLHHNERQTHRVEQHTQRPDVRRPTTELFASQDFRSRKLHRAHEPVPEVVRIPARFHGSRAEIDQLDVVVVVNHDVFVLETRHTSETVESKLPQVEAQPQTTTHLDVTMDHAL